jgi:hypothetical protein
MYHYINLKLIVAHYNKVFLENFEKIGKLWIESKEIVIAM